MKRLIAWILCTALLSGVSVCFADSESWICPECGKEVSSNFCPYCGTQKPAVEETDYSVPEGAFSIRNGIRWGMKGYDVATREENLKKDDERDYYYDPEIGDITFLYYYPDETTVSIFPCNLTYAFSRDKLFLLMYQLEYNDTSLEDIEAFVYLKNAVISKYGQGRDATADDEEMVRNVMSIAQTYFYEDEVKRLTVWDLPDGTSAALVQGYYCADSRLLFFHYGTMLNNLPKDGAYNTNGL